MEGKIVKKILFATDGSRASAKAVETVRHLLEAWPEARLTVLYVTRVEGRETLSELVQADEEAYAREIESAVHSEWFAREMERVQFEHQTGQPAFTIANVAQEGDYDLIVVGSHGRGEVDRLLLGSTSHGVVYCSHISVLVVKD